MITVEKNDDSGGDYNDDSGTDDVYVVSVGYVYPFPLQCLSVASIPPTI